MTTAPKPPPLVEEALERLRGRRADAIVNASTHRFAETKGQNRKTRRNNLRLARLEVKARRKALAESMGDTSLWPDTVERPRLADQKP